MSNARLLFDRMPDKDSAAFNAMIDGNVKLGDMGSAQNLFDEMTDRNVVCYEPNFCWLLRGNQKPPNLIMDYFEGV